MIRPAITEDLVAKILSGYFPNFTAAYILSLFFVNSVLRLKSKRGRLIVYSGSGLVAAIFTFQLFKMIKARKGTL